MGVKLLCGGRQNRFIDLMVTQNGKYHGGHFPRHVADDRHVFEPFCGFLLVIRTEHRIALYSDLRRHPDASAQIRRAPFGHMRVRSLELAGLIDRRIDANIGCELVRRRKTGDISDFAENDGSNDRSNAGNRRDRRIKALKQSGYFFFQSVSLFGERLDLVEHQENQRGIRAVTVFNAEAVSCKLPEFTRLPLTEVTVAAVPEQLRQLSSTHNALWNWAGVYTWCQETYSSNTSFRAVRGFYSARFWSYYYATYSYPRLGFRPVLEILNTDPLISDSDRDLGDKNSNFTITYTVDDADSGDVLTATESLDGQTTKSFAPTRNLVNTISVDVDSLSLGKHTVKVVVSDGQGGTATRTWTFTRTNSAPTISGSDGNLGDKNLGFTYAYTIDDADGDTLTVVEELNDETIRTINNAPKGEELTVTITSEKLYALGLNSVNTLKITVTDGKGGTAYRRVTFKRTNSAPTISGQDKALGLKNGSFAENYTVSDVEGDNVVVTEFVDDVQIRSYQATLGQQETIELTREKWLSLTNGQHQLRIEAVDGNFATSVRVFSFSKKETVIKFELAAPEETDAAATKVLVTPTWKIEGAVAKVEACNNGFDAVPTWEDITAMVQINRVYNFTNKTKTASKWGVNIRFTITKNEGFEGEVSISGFGGAYE